MWIIHILFIHSPIDLCLDCSYFLVLMHNAVNVYVPVFVWLYIFISLGHLYRCGIAESCGNSMFKLFVVLPDLSSIIEYPHFLYSKREKNQLELFCSYTRVLCIN